MSERMLRTREKNVSAPFQATQAQVTMNSLSVKRVFMIFFVPYSHGGRAGADLQARENKKGARDARLNLACALLSTKYVSFFRRVLVLSLFLAGIVY